jgi:predicted GNAT family acetyltransferase
MVRRAEADDWRTVRHVRLAALTDSPDAFITTLVEAERYPDSLWQQRVAATAHFLAFVHDQPAGMAVVIPDDPSPQLVGVWVSPDFRGSGAVDGLVRAAADEVVRQGYDELRLWVVTGNRRAERAYTRAGFHPTGRTQPVPGRPHDVELEMSRALSSRDALS